MKWLLHYKFEMALGAGAYCLCVMSLQFWQMLAARAALFAVGAIVMLLMRQSSMLYVPDPSGTGVRGNSANPKMYRSPEEWGMPFERVVATAADGTRRRRCRLRR